MTNHDVCECGHHHSRHVTEDGGRITYCNEWVDCGCGHYRPALRECACVVEGVRLVAWIILITLMCLLAAGVLRAAPVPPLDRARVPGEYILMYYGSEWACLLYRDGTYEGWPTRTGTAGGLWTGTWRKDPDVPNTLLITETPPWGTLSQTFRASTWDGKPRDLPCIVLIKRR